MLQTLVSRAWSGLGLPVLFVAIYAVVYLVRFPLLTWYNVPHTTFASLTSHHPLAAIALVLAGLASVALCWRMWRLAPSLPRRAAIPLIVGGWLGACACAILTFPGQSTDMGDYTFSAHMLVHLDRNPLITAPVDLIAWEEFPYLSWYWEPDSYGPLWQGLSRTMHTLAGENLLANFLAYKLLAAAAIGVSGWLIYAILARMATGYAVAGLALWLWNPVILNEGVIHGHNDLVLIPLVLGGIALLLRGGGPNDNDASTLSGARRTGSTAQDDPKPAPCAVDTCTGTNRPVQCRRGAAILRATCTDVMGILLLVMAGLIKANIWIFLPVAALWLVRRRGLRRGVTTVALGLLAGAALVWLAYRPFGGWNLLANMAQRRGWWPANSWTAALFFALRDGAGWPHEIVVRWIIGGASALCALVAGIAMLRLRELRLAAWAVALAYLLIGSHWFQPWYATWVIALAAVVPSRRVAGYTLVLSFFMLLHPIIQDYVVSRLVLPPGGSHAVMAAAVLLVPQVLALGLILNRRRSAA